MFPVKKAAVLDQVARGVTGEDVSRDKLNILNLMNDDTLTKFTDNAVNKLWGKFVNFGSVSAGVIMIGIILGIIKYVLNAIIHGYVLYRIYGFGARILGALWRTIANLLIHLGQGNNTQTRRRRHRSK